MAHTINIILFAIAFIILGYLGVKPVTAVLKELGTQMTLIYFLFFLVMWIHSRPQSANYIAWFVGLTVAILAMTFIRYNPEATEDAAQIAWQWSLSVAYLALTLLLPALVKAVNTEKEVPERVTG